MQVTKTIIIAIVVFFTSVNSGRAGEPPEYFCYRLQDAILIDGKLDENSWIKAPSMEFLDLVKGTQPLFPSYARMLWNENYLYVGITAETPNVWGTYTGDFQMKKENGGRTFADAIMMRDPFVKVFLDPDGDGKKYMEFHVNALNIVNDVYLITGSTRTDRQNISLSEDNYHMEWNCPDLKHAVYVDGTLNYADDVDKKYTVEIAFPWNSLKPFFKGNCPPAAGDVFRAHLGRVHREKLSGDRMYWTWPVIGVMDCHQLHKWGFIKFSDSIIK